MIDRASRVAVVDDDPLVLRGLRRLLRAAGFDVDTYASGTDFLRSAAAADCVILDLHMPNTSGYDVQARLGERGDATPIIVITGDDTPESRSRALRLGAKGYFGKPVNEQMLLAAIAAAVGVLPY